jgi:hypothetical protein
VTTEATARVSPSARAPALEPTPAAVLDACRSLVPSRTVLVLCPARLPVGRWAVTHTTLRNGRCAYLLDANTRPFGQSIPFHALAGGRCHPWPLATRRGRWPAAAARLPDDLGLIGAKPLKPGQPGSATSTPVPPRVLRHIHVGEHPGLLLQEATYPNGGVHGGHIAAIWNQDGNGYVLSLHFTEPTHAPTASWQQMVIRAADTMRP